MLVFDINLFSINRSNLMKSIDNISLDVQRISSFNKREGRPKALLCSSSPSCLRPVSVSAPSPLRPASHRPATSTGGQKDSTTTVQGLRAEILRAARSMGKDSPAASERGGRADFGQSLDTCKRQKGSG